MANRDSSAWTPVTNRTLLAQYGVKDINKIVRAYVKIFEFANTTNFSQRLDILIYRVGEEPEYKKVKILSDLDEFEIKENFPGIKTLTRVGI